MAAVLAGVLAGGKLIGRALQPSHPMLSDRDLTSVSQPTAQPAGGEPCGESKARVYPRLPESPSRAASSRSEPQRSPRRRRPGPRSR
jgi:hypothetical protein